MPRPCKQCGKIFENADKTAIYCRICGKYEQELDPPPLLSDFQESSSPLPPLSLPPPRGLPSLDFSLPPRLLRAQAFSRKRLMGDSSDHHSRRVRRETEEQILERHRITLPPKFSVNPNDLKSEAVRLYRDQKIVLHERSSLNRLADGVRFAFPEFFPFNYHDIDPQVSYDEKLMDWSTKYKPLLTLIYRKCKSRVNAHGIELEKGGVTKLIAIMLIGCLFKASYSIGPFCLYTFCSDPFESIEPGITSGGHGPFYIIIQGVTGKQNYPEETHHTYLVPEDEQKKLIINVLNMAIQKRFLKQEEYRVIIQKIKTYDEFLILLQNPEVLEALMEPE